MLPARFALIFDGWTCDHAATHYLAVSASYMSLEDKPERVLLGFTAFDDETSFTAKNHKRCLKTILQLFGKTWDNVVCFIGDNCSTNKALADLCKLPLVGCAAHRFNLEVQMFLETSSVLIQKVQVQCR